MKKRYDTSFRRKILNTIYKIDGAVVLRKDLKELGDPRQISRILKALVEDGILIKLGYGVYGKSEKTPYSSQPILTAPLAQVCIEALNRLGKSWDIGSAIQSYNKGETEQVPINFTVRLRSRFRGELGTPKRKIIFENNINAR